MPRPAEGYRSALSGVPFPGSTDIIRLWGDKEGLIRWSRCQGHAQALRGLPKPDHWDRSDLNIGHVVHGMAEFYLRGKDFEFIRQYAESTLKSRDEACWQEHFEKAASAFREFVRWCKQHRVKIVELELSLVSEIHKFGGTLDIVALVDGELCIIDIKTSAEGKVFEEHLLQLAAYRELWSENRKGRGEKIRACWLLVLPKNGGSCQPHYYPAAYTRAAWREFLALRQAFDYRAEGKRSGLLAGAPIPEPKPAKRDVIDLRKARRPSAAGAISPPVYTPDAVAPQINTTYSLRVSASFAPISESRAPENARPTLDAAAVPSLTPTPAAASPLPPAASGTSRPHSQQLPDGGPAGGRTNQLPPARAERSTADGGVSRGPERGGGNSGINPDDGIPTFLRRARQREQVSA